VKENVLDTSVVLLLNWVSCIALFFFQHHTDSNYSETLKPVIRVEGPSEIRTGLRFFYDLLRDTMSFRMFRIH